MHAPRTNGKTELPAEALIGRQIEVVVDPVSGKFPAEMEATPVFLLADLYGLPQLQGEGGVEDGQAAGVGDRIAQRDRFVRLDELAVDFKMDVEVAQRVPSAQILRQPQQQHGAEKNKGDHIVSRGTAISSSRLETNRSLSIWTLLISVRRWGRTQTASRLTSSGMT